MRRGREYWRGLVEELRLGARVVDVARRHRVQSSTLAWWRWKLSTEPPQTPSFLPIVVRDATEGTTSTGAVELRLRDLCIRVAQDTDVAYVAALVEAPIPGRLPFYEALEVNDSAVKVLGDESLRTIARELVDTVRRNATIDWQVRESVRARLRILVKRTLRKYGYPPDKQEAATNTVLQQAELLSTHWSDAAF